MKRGMRQYVAASRAARARWPARRGRIQGRGVAGRNVVVSGAATRRGGSTNSSMVACIVFAAACAGKAARCAVGRRRSAGWRCWWPWWAGR